MYIRSYDGWEQGRPPFSYRTPGLADGAEKETQISREIVNNLTDLVFFARHPKLMGTEIKGNRSLELEYHKIHNQLLNPSSTGLPTGFEIKLTGPTNPQPDYSKTEWELGLPFSKPGTKISVWELAIFNTGPFFKFSTQATVMSDGKPGSYVSSLSVKFDNASCTVHIAKHFYENSKDTTTSAQVRNGWSNVIRLIQTHAYGHLDLYRRAAKNMGKVLEEMFSRLLPLPTAKRPLAVSQNELDVYMFKLGEFLTAIVNLEFWQKNCDWEKEDYPRLGKKINDVGVVGISPAGLAVVCSSKPHLPNIPLPPVPIKAK